MTTMDTHSNHSGLPPRTSQRRRRSENSGNYGNNNNSNNNNNNNNNHKMNKTSINRTFPKKDLGECKFFNTPQGCHAVGCGFQHSVIPEGCRRGNTCGFVHSPNALPRSLPQQESTSRRQPYNNRLIRSTPTQIRRQDSQQGDEPLNAARFKSLCHFYNSSTGCRLGNQCGFVHKVITPNVTVCHFYGTEKGCQVAKCGFIHQQQQQTQQ